MYQEHHGLLLVRIAFSRDTEGKMMRVAGNVIAFSGVATGGLPNSSA